MDKKRLLPLTQGSHSSPKKIQTHENNADGNQNDQTRPSERRVRFQVPAKQSHTNTQSNRTSLKRASPYTEEFFANMADTIVSSFPYTEFAKGNGCMTKDVIKAIRATVFEPLCKPSIKEATRLEPADAASTRTTSPPVTPQPRRPTVRHVPGPATTPEAPSHWNGASQSGCPKVLHIAAQATVSEAPSHWIRKDQTGKSEVKEDSETTESSNDNARPTSAVFQPLSLLESRRGTKKRKTMVPAERLLVQQNIFSKYVPVKPQTRENSSPDTTGNGKL
ncbi:uncharacterized protein DSM5745_05565 [Aspergillus mulundensis]|uniref:Uncharacterized protein n=1 Tax=Aspergillus mulundensis TaxID=1810919 RepID=A0A3D8RXE1_9EURO|nr:hypothetical protein DSM5745_05565 [Aspergillus mulundensis]RDW78713.1 hypothetical protein DSM5745_05565 [Aspergillus mulundensis]